MKAIGIDLGTTNSVVSILQNNRSEVIVNPEGGKTTPSVVLYEEGGDVIVGELAKRQRVAQPRRAIYSAKRFIGQRWDECEHLREGISYDLDKDNEGRVIIKIDDKIRLRPEEVSSRVLAKMRMTAEDYLGEKIENAVITVPAHFNDMQRSATKLAGEAAGLNVLRIINEPTAAALAFGLGSDTPGTQKVAVFDFGGGTFDISILDIEADIIEVKATNGDTYLGGDNINQILSDWICKRVQEETGIDPKTEVQAHQRIIETAEKVKCELSTLEKTLISLPFLVSDASGPKHFNGEIKRKEFEELIAPILEKLRPPCEQAMFDANIIASELSAVLMVGGSTRIPAVRQLVREVFQCEPNCSLNPDEVVAQGAAIQGGIMTGELDEILLLDVTPLSLGIELAGNVFAPLIPRNSSVPTTATKRYTTVVDNQTVVKIHVMQGERKIASENRSLDHFRLTNIPPAPREIPEIEVRFSIDANGILTVSAMDLTSEVSQEIRVESYMPGGDEVDRIAADAEKHADEDKTFMEKAEIWRRMHSLEAEFKEVQRRKGAEEYITEEHEQQIREVLFRWDVALSASSWEEIDEAERNAKALLMELNSLFVIGSAAKKKKQTTEAGLDDGITGMPATKSLDD